ncbi:MAG: glycosyltransferase [Acidimicrobiales bacterium]
MTPRVSVVIRTHGRARLFRAALASARAQTLRDIEIVVVEDGGPEYAADIAAEIGDARIRVLRNEVSCGVGPATLRGAEAARSRFLAFLDDDDLWDPTFLATLVEPLSRDEGVVVAFCRRRIIDVDGATIGVGDPRNWEDRLRWPEARGAIEPFVHEALVDPVISVAQSAVVDTRDVDWSFLKTAGPCWDNRLAHQLCRRPGAAWYEPTALSSYRIHDVAMSAETPTLSSRVSTYRSYLRDEQLSPWHDGLSRRLARQLESRALAFSNETELRQARRDMREAVRLDPTFRSLRALVVLQLPASPARRLVDGYQRAHAATRRRRSTRFSATD